MNAPKESKIDNFLSDNLYTRLGVSTEAKKPAIKKKYLMLAKQWHPDAMPDHPEAATVWGNIQEAWNCLGNDDERAYYDRNGKFGKAKIKQDDIDKFILMNFENVIGNAHEVRRHRSPFDTIRDNLMNNLQKERDKIPRAQAEATRLSRMKSRVKYRGTGKNLIHDYYDKLIAEQEDNKTNASIAIDLIEATLPQLSFFEWLELDPDRSEGSLQLPGSRRPQFVEDMRNNRQPTQQELMDLHRRSGRGY